MYVDSSRVELLAKYAELAESGSEAALRAHEAEVQLFVESAWALASGEGRGRFMDALGDASESMPWAAVRVGADAEGSADRGPAALELLLAQEDPGDEGVESYQLDPETNEGREALAAMRAWDVAVLDVIAAPAGWRDPVQPNDRPIDDVDDVDDVGDGHDDNTGGAASEDKASEGDVGESSATPKVSALLARWWPWAAVVGGLGVAGAMVFYPRDRGE